MEILLNSVVHVQVHVTGQRGITDSIGQNDRSMLNV